jgi:hypothetical protein
MVIPYSARGGSHVLARVCQPAFEKVLEQRILSDGIQAGTAKVGKMELVKA